MKKFFSVTLGILILCPLFGNAEMKGPSQKVPTEEKLCDYSGFWEKNGKNCYNLCEQNEVYDKKPVLDFPITQARDQKERTAQLAKIAEIRKQHCTRFCKDGEEPKNNSCIKVCRTSECARKKDKQYTELKCEEGKFLIYNDNRNPLCENAIGNYKNDPPSTDSPVKLNEKTGAPSSKTPAGGGQSGSQGRDR